MLSQHSQGCCSSAWGSRGQVWSRSISTVCLLWKKHDENKKAKLKSCQHCTSYTRENFFKTMKWIHLSENRSCQSAESEQLHWGSLAAPSTVQRSGRGCCGQNWTPSTRSDHWKRTPYAKDLQEHNAGGNIAVHVHISKFGLVRCFCNHEGLLEPQRVKQSILECISLFTQHYRIHRGLARIWNSSSWYWWICFGWRSLLRLS